MVENVHVYIFKNAKKLWAHNKYRAIQFWLSLKKMLRKKLKSIFIGRNSKIIFLLDGLKLSDLFFPEWVFSPNEYSYKKINIVLFMFELRLSVEVSKEKLHSHDHKAWGCWNQIMGSVGASFMLKSAYAVPYSVTFEDKRKANYERGNMELEKRRQAMMEQQQREAERKAQKEKEEWERKQRELQEQEWKKQLELEKRLEKQRELERQREEERRKEIERREVIFFFKLFYFQGNHFL